MTDAIPPLQVDIVFNVSSIGAGVAKANAAIDSISGRSAKMAQGLSGLKTTMAGVFGGNLLTQGFLAIQSGLQGMQHEFQTSQQSMARLQTVFKNMGPISKEQQAAVNENIEAYGRLGFKTSETADAYGTLITQTGNVAQSTKLMALAADYARYRNIDLNTSARLMAKTTQGSTKVFKDLGISLDETLPKNQAISKAFDEMNARIGGQAKNAAGTAGVQMQILRERLQNVYNVVATKVLPIINAFFAAISKAFTWVEQNQGALKVFAIGLGFIATAMYGVAAAEAAIAAVNPFVWIAAGIAAVAVGFVALWNHVEGFRKVMAGMASVAVQAVGLVIGAFASLMRLLSRLPGGKFLKGVADAADKAAVAVGKTGESIEKLANKKITAPKVGGLPTGGVVPGTSTGIVGNAKGGDAAGTGGGGGTNVQYVTVYASDTNDIYKKLSKAAKNGAPIGGR